MKKFVLSLLLCSSIIIPAQLPIVVAPGNLQLHDNGNTGGLQRGVIMDMILNNSQFQQEKETIQEFLNIPTTSPNINFTYQQILQKVQQSTDPVKAIAIIEAFEKALMHKYHYDSYALGTYRPWSSIIITGVKYSWINPIKWLNPTKLFNDDSNDAKQLINELENLSKIAYLHSDITHQRLSLMVHSYRHWRRNLTLSLITYLSADTYARGWKNSTLNDLHKGGLSNTPVILDKLGENLVNGTNAAIATTSKAGSYGYSFVKPIVHAICYGNGGKEIEPKKWWQKTQRPTETSNQSFARYCTDTCSSYINLLTSRITQGTNS